VDRRTAAAVNATCNHLFTKQVLHRDPLARARDPPRQTERRVALAVFLRTCGAVGGRGAAGNGMKAASDDKRCGLSDQDPKNGIRFFYKSD